MNSTRNDKNKITKTTKTLFMRKIIQTTDATPTDPNGLNPLQNNKSTTALNVHGMYIFNP